MKKVYCFYCQQDVEPYKIWKWRICPHCFRPTEDDGEGLYLVCDKCGANMPVTAEVCPKCGCDRNGVYVAKVPCLPSLGRSILQNLAAAGMVVVSLILFGFLLYVSFYLFAGLLFVGLLFWLFQRIGGSRF